MKKTIPGREPHDIPYTYAGFYALQPSAYPIDHKYYEIYPTQSLHQLVTMRSSRFATLCCRGPAYQTAAYPKFNSKSNRLANSSSLCSCSLFLCNSLSYSALGLYGVATGWGGDTDGTGNGELLRRGFVSTGRGNGEEYLCIRAGSHDSSSEFSLTKNGRGPGPGPGEVCP